jgi:LuxR family maltose regulon positive regulatory protein
LRSIDPLIGGGLGDSLEDKRLPLKPFLFEVINVLAAFGRDIVIALDDYHTITNCTVHDLMTLFIDKLPDSTHLVILSRSGIPFPLNRLRVRDQLVEIRSEQLRFTDAEAAVLLGGSLSPPLSAEDAGILARKTEGWITGLRLAAISFRENPDASVFASRFSGSNRYVIEYLTEEVLGAQPPEVQRFLLFTSVLDSLRGPLCDALTGTSDGQAELERLESENLFLYPLDDQHRLYRYHRLFAEFLRDRLEVRYPGESTRLRCAARAWFEKMGMFDDATDQAIAGGELDLALDLIEAKPSRRKRQKILDWLRVIPEEIIRSRPRLGLYYAWSLAASGQIGAAEGWLGIGGSGQPESAGMNEFAGIMASVQAFLSVADIPLAHGRAATGFRPTAAYT